MNYTLIKKQQQQKANPYLNLPGTIFIMGHHLLLLSGFPPHLPPGYWSLNPPDPDLQVNILMADSASSNIYSNVISCMKTDHLNFKTDCLTFLTEVPVVARWK